MLRGFAVGGVAGVGVGRRRLEAGLYGHHRSGWSGDLFVGRGEWDVSRRVQVVSQRSDLLPVPAVHLLHHRRPAVLSSFVKRAVGSQTEESPTETREAQSDEDEDDGQDEEEDDEQSHSDRVGLWSSRGRAAVHAAAVTGVPAVRWSPAHVTVTVLITVTHPVTVTLAAAVVHAEHRHVLTLLVQTGLAGPAGGALGHGGGVGHVVAQVEEGPSADQVAVVEAHRGGQDLCVGAQQGALPPPLTLDPPAVNVGVSTGDVGAVGQLTTVSIFVSLFVH